MDQRTIPEDLQRTYETARGLGNSTGWLGPLGNQVVNLIERIALAESQAAELREEVERLRRQLADETAIVDRIWDIYGRPSYAELAGRTIYDLINADRAENATLREQVDAQLTEINQLYMELERQQRTVTLLVPEFLEAMADIGEYGFEKYGEGSFQARRLKGDNSRGPLERCKSINVCLHGEDHLDAYVRGDKHDHFGTLEHQLAAAAFNAMMEFYFAGFASRSREQEPGK